MPICPNPVRFLEIVRPSPAWLGWTGGAAHAVTLGSSSGVALWGWCATRRTESEGEELKR